MLKRHGLVNPGLAAAIVAAVAAAAVTVAVAVAAAVETAGNHQTLAKNVNVRARQCLALLCAWGY